MDDRTQGSPRPIRGAHDLDPEARAVPPIAGRRPRPAGRLRASARARTTLAAVATCLLASCGGSPTDSGASGDVAGGERPSFEDLFGPILLKADGSQVGLRSVQDKALVGIYFAVPSCPACRAFTPALVSAYDELMTAERSFEIVLVSLGESSEEMFAFMEQYDMRWLALPYEPGKLLALAQRYGVEWVPTLVVIDGERRTVTKTGREDVAAMGAGAYDVWLAATPLG